MPMELHAFTHEVPGSSPGGSNIRGHSSMAEHEVSSKILSSHFYHNDGHLTFDEMLSQARFSMNKSDHFQLEDNHTLASDLAALGYPGFSHLTSCRKAEGNRKKLQLAI